MTPANAPSDFIQVQLTAAGIAFAGKSGTVRIANGHFAYVFAAAPVRVLISEWSRTLSGKKINGAAILEAVPAAPVKAGPAPTRTISPGSSHTDAPEQTAAKPAAAASAAEPQAEVK